MLAHCEGQVVVRRLNVRNLIRINITLAVNDVELNIRDVNALRVHLEVDSTYVVSILSQLCTTILETDLLNLANPWTFLCGSLLPSAVLSVIQVLAVRIVDSLVQTCVVSAHLRIGGREYGQVAHVLAIVAHQSGDADTRHVDCTNHSVDGLLNLYVIDSVLDQVIDTIVDGVDTIVVRLDAVLNHVHTTLELVNTTLSFNQILTDVLNAVIKSVTSSFEDSNTTYCIVNLILQFSSYILKVLVNGSSSVVHVVLTRNK